MSEESAIREIIDSLDSAVFYMREHLNEFGKRRLGEIYQDRSVESAMIHVLFSRTDPAAFLEQLVKPTAHLCHDQLRERPDAPQEVYHTWIQFWREMGEQSFDEAISTLKTGLDQHPESAMLHADLASEYFLEMVQAKERSDWQKVKDYASGALKYARQTGEIDSAYRTKHIEIILRLAPKMAETAEQMLSGDPRARLTDYWLQSLIKRK